MLKIRIDLFEQKDPRETISKSLLIFCLNADDLFHLKKGTIARIPGQQLMAPEYDFLISYNNTTDEVIDRLFKDGILSEEDVKAIVNTSNTIRKTQSMATIIKNRVPR